MPVINVERSCGECTTCCQGHLSGTAHGYEFFPGKPCHFVNKSGCSIYPYRPHDPCQTFKCEWKVNKSFPVEYRPDKLKVLFVKRILGTGEYRLDILEAGAKIDAEVLHFIITMFNKKQYDYIRYEFNGEFHELKR